MKDLLNRIVNACYAAGATPKVYLSCTGEVDVALGHDWMDNATDTGTKYDKLIDELNAMSTEEVQLCPCAAVYGSSIQRIY